jgi:hypothetical protein
VWLLIDCDIVGTQLIWTDKDEKEAARYRGWKLSLDVGQLAPRRYRDRRHVTSVSGACIDTRIRLGRYLGLASLKSQTIIQVIETASLEFGRALVKKNEANVATAEQTIVCVTRALKKALRHCGRRASRLMLMEMVKFGDRPSIFVLVVGQETHAGVLQRRQVTSLPAMERWPAAPQREPPWTTKLCATASGSDRDRLQLYPQLPLTSLHYLIFEPLSTSLTR